MISRLLDHSYLTNMPITRRQMSEGVADLSNYEKYVVFQMFDRYKVILGHEVFLNTLHQLDEQMTKLKSEYNFVMSQKMTVEKEKDRYHRRLTLDGTPGTAHQSEVCAYFHMRIIELSEQCLRIKRTLDRLKKEFTGLLYSPLLNCVKQICSHHETRKCIQGHCGLKSGDKWDLSKILLAIFQACPIVVSKYDNFSKWNIVNIYSHPLVQASDETMDQEISNRIFSSGIFPSLSSFRTTEKTLSDIELAADKLRARQMITFFLLCRERLCPKTKVVFSINGVGNIIYTFLLGKEAYEECLLRVGEKVGASNRKRKFNI